MSDVSIGFRLLTLSFLIVFQVTIASQFLQKSLNIVFIHVTHIRARIFIQLYNTQ